MGYLVVLTIIVPVDRQNNGRFGQDRNSQPDHGRQGLQNNGEPCIHAAVIDYGQPFMKLAITSLEAAEVREDLYSCIDRV